LRNKSVKKIKKFEKSFVKRLTNSRNCGIIIIERGEREKLQGDYIMTMIKKLDWMTEEHYEQIYFYWGCVCDYDMHWDNEQDYEEWCKRVLKKLKNF
jgi:hypothetical protein